MANETLAERDLAQALRRAMDLEGISEMFLAKKLKRELNAKKTSYQKVRGEIEAEGLQPGAKVIGKTVTKGEDGKKKVIESVVAVDEVAWDVRQKARMDAQRIRGDYPAESHIFPGKDGQPQSITGELNSLEAASRLVFLIGEAMRRRKGQQQVETGKDNAGGDYGDNIGG